MRKAEVRMFDRTAGTLVEDDDGEYTFAYARGVKESRWRWEQGLHIRWNVVQFADQYERISKLGDENLRHDYVTNFCCNACTLLNIACKTAPNTSNLVERYYNDWDERIEKAERSKKGVR